jgi:AcrR family transcriptional regulator
VTPVRADRRGVARRRQIIDAAIEVFTRRGFRGSSLTEVAEQAGITAAGVLYHFNSKDELLLEVIRERDRRQGPILEEVARAGGLASITGAVRFAEIAEQEPHLQALHTVLEIESLDPDSPAYEYFRARNEFLLRGTEANLRRLQVAGDITADVDCARIARQIMAFEHGAAVLWLRNPTLSIVELFRDYFDDLVERLRPRP